MTGDKMAYELVARIVTDAGGRIVGRTKLQKLAYLLELVGLGGGFQFEYRHYGPYSEDLADAVRIAQAFGLIREEEKRASWGGTYSVYSALGPTATEQQRGNRASFVDEVIKIDSITLELAATAAYLSAVEGRDDPWEETARRKPEKAAGNRLETAKEAYRRLLRHGTPRPLPAIV